MKRTVKQSIYGNWRGYVSGKLVIEFGDDERWAKHWLDTGETEKWEAYK